MIARRLLTGLLLLALLTLPVLADESCEYRQNRCDEGIDGGPGYEARQTRELNYLYTYYNQLHNNDLFVKEESEPLRYPAALLYFQKGLTTMANELLDKERTEANGYDDLDPLSSVYLAWIHKEYQRELTGDTADAVAQWCADYQPAADDERTFFLSRVARYLCLMADEKGTDGITSNLATLLRDKGDAGWEAEVNPGVLSDLAIGLAALYRHSDDPTLHTLADMHLDLLFTRFSVLNAAGSFGGPRFGDTPAAGAYDPAASLWYTWSGLLFDTEATAGRHAEPALAMSGWCASEATIGVHWSRLVRQSAPASYRIKERYPGGGRALTLATPDYVLSGTQDLGADIDPFIRQEGWVTRASLRYTDNPYSFLTLSTRVCPESEGSVPDGQPDHGALFTMVDLTGPDTPDTLLLLGRVGQRHDGSDPAKACREPHLFIGKGFRIVDESHPLITILERNGDYWAFQFFQGQAHYATGDRYAPLAATIPPVFYDQFGDTKERGRVIIPLDSAFGGAFALEKVPPQFITLLHDTDSQITSSVYSNTSLEMNDGEIIYQTRLSSAMPAVEAKTYTYEAPGSVSAQPASGLSVITNPANYEPRQALSAAHDPITYENGKWTLKSATDNNQVVETILDFQATVQEMKTSDGYECADGSNAGGSGSTGLASQEKRLAYLAASMLEHRENEEYTMDCGRPHEVIPNALSPLDHNPAGADDHTNPAEAACVLTHGSTYTIGFLYDDEFLEGSTTPVQKLLELMNAYPPIEGSRDNTLCDAVASGTDFRFTRCDEGFLDNFDGESVYVNPAAEAMIVSTVADPFSENALDALLTFLIGLFGTVADPGADLEELSHFTHAYFKRATGDGKEVLVNGQIQNGEAIIHYENLAADLTSLADNAGVTRTANGQVQTLSFSASGSYLETWRDLTSRLRISAEGEATDFGAATCGDGILQYGEECDPDNETRTDWTAWDAYESCADGANNVTCARPGEAAECLLNRSACTNCEPYDQDDDEYHFGGSNCNPQGDCLDADPASYTVTCDQAIGDTLNPPVSCSGDAYPCSGFTKDEAACQEYPTNKCPQCIYPGAPEFVNGADSDCNGIPDNQDPAGGDDPFACPEVEPSEPPDYTSQYGLTCYYTTPNTMWLSNPETEERVQRGVYQFRENYRADDEKPALIITRGERGTTDCDIRNPGDSAAARDYVLPNNEYDTPYRIWGGSRLSVSLVVTGSDPLTWRLDVDFDPPPLHDPLFDQFLAHDVEEFLSCWFSEDAADWQDAFGITGAIAPGDLVEIENWAETTISTNSSLGDTIPLECEVSQDPPGTWASPCEYLCDIQYVETAFCGNDICEPGEDESNCDADCDAPADPPHAGECVSDNDCLPHECCRWNFCMSCHGCFVPATPVLTPQGERPIEELRAGDQVLAYDLERGARGVGTITERFVHEEQPERLLLNGELRVTPSHPFATARGWVPAGELVVGDRLRTASEEWRTLESIEWEENEGPVYNFHVEPQNTYYAGGLLVHNTKSGNPPPGYMIP